MKDSVHSRQSIFEEDDGDSLLFEKLQDHVLERYRNPARDGCLDHSILETWVNSPQSLDLSDPKYLHVLKCSECTRELIELRKRRDARSAAQIGTEATSLRKERWWGIAVLAFAIAFGGVAYWRVHSPASSSAAIPATPIALTLDLSQATSGVESPAAPLTLPRRVVAAHILLPDSSPAGKYDISVTSDKVGSPARTEGMGSVNARGFHADLTVTLDLRDVPPGSYFLATIHEGDQSSSYYPLAVR